MSNQSEIDYEKQFHDDLAKATALSLEQQALDEYNRTTKYGHSSGYYEGARKSSSAISVKEEYAAQLRQQQEAYARSTSLNNSDRNVYSLVNKATNATPTAADNTVENDLINFNSPTTQKPNEQQTFEKLINDLQKFQITTTHVQTALVPMPTRPALMGTYAETQPAAAVTAAGAAGLQLVPFMATQKLPLTNENLKQLYNMSYGPHTAVAPRPPAPAAYPMGFVAPAAVSAAFMPPQNARYPYQYAATIPFNNTSYATASTPPTASVNGPPPNFPLPMHAKPGSASSTTEAKSLPRHISMVSGESNIMRRHSRTATGDDLIDLNQLDEYV